MEEKLNRIIVLLEEVNAKLDYRPAVHFETCSTDADDSFNAFWSLYPTRNGKKVGKQQAKKMFDRIKDKDQILVATKHYAVSQQVQRGYGKDPVRFLKDSYWQDWLEPEIELEEWQLKALKERHVHVRKNDG